MDRTKFCEIVSIEGVKELDYLRNNLARFTLKYTPTKYVVTDADLLRPDMISYRNYGDVGYWWIIMYVNSIDSPLTDLVTGMTLDVPNLLDLYDFYKQYVVR